MPGESPQRCSNCDSVVAAVARFCSACGAMLPRGDSVDALPARVQPAPMPAERRLVTALFCDVVGSSGLMARLDPEDFAALLAAYQTRCADAVKRHGGHVSNYIGDGILATFGYPRALGGDAEAATNCGIEIARLIQDFARRTNLPGGRELAVRVGIESGIVVAGRVPGESGNMIDMLIGSSLNVAARLQQLAPPFGVVIGDTTHELVREFFDCEELPADLLLPIKPPIQRAFRVTPPASLQRGAPALGNLGMVGREAELAQLLAHWEKAQGGAGQVVLVSGEAGIGKSHFVREFLAQAGLPNRQAVMLNCTPQATATALHPAIEALRRWLATAAVATGAQLDAAWARLLAGAAGVPQAQAARVLEATLAGSGAGAAADLEPSVWRQTLMELLQGWLLGGGAPGAPFLILVEDVHWSDPSLLELLQAVSASLAGLPGMLVLTCRSGQLPAALEPLAALRLGLLPLGEAEARRLLAAVGATALAFPVQAEILARADGVPLFLQEFALAAGRAALPRTLQQVFTARLDALEEAKPLAQYAAVLGGEAERDLLAAIAGLDEAALEAQLRRLVAAEVLVAGAGAVPGGGFSFRHRLLQEAAYDSLLHAERRRLHARAADLLERLRPTLATRRPEMLASHRAAAAQHGAAVPLFVRAIERALAESALEEAEEQGRCALASAAALEWPQSGHAELELRVLIGRVVLGRSGYSAPAVREMFQRASQLAAVLQDDRRSLGMLSGLVSFYQVRGPLSEARALCTRFTAAAETAGEPLNLAAALRQQAWNSLCMGDLASAEAGLLRSIDLLADVAPAAIIAAVGHDTRVLAMASLCCLEMLRRGPAHAMATARQAIAVADASPHAVSACYALAFAAVTLQIAGAWDEAQRHALRCRDLAARKGIAYWQAMSRAILGRDAVWRGDAAAGREAIRLGLYAYRQTEAELLRPLLLILLADAEEALGATDLARQALEEAERSATALEAHGFLPVLLLRRAMLDTLPGGAGERAALLDRAEAMARAQGADAVARAAAAARLEHGRSVESGLAEQG